MPVKKIHIGTSGWSYKHWKTIFYPGDMDATDYLSFYARHFKITEINTSFYHLPKPQTVLNWVDKVPAGFKFCPKISRYLTHIKRLNEPEEPLSRFFEIFNPVKKFLGPVLVQLPPSSKFDFERTEHFYRVLKTAYADFDFAMEVRHDSWFCDESLHLMTQFDIALVISQSGSRFPYAETVTAKNVYVRFHGPEALYASSYTEEQLNYFAEKFLTWAKDGHVIWAFFNNDVGGHALNNANRLVELTKKS